MDCDITVDDATLNKLSKLLPNHKLIKEVCKRIAFSQLISQIPIPKDCANSCCGRCFETDNQFKRHISTHHSELLTEFATKLETSFYEKLHKSDELKQQDRLVTGFEKNELYVPENFSCSCAKNFQVVLYYHYTAVKQTSCLILWQNKLCHKLNLTGKIRIASEGVNGTLEGCECTLREYVVAMRKVFISMTEEDFKLSSGDGNAFKNLKITECEELCSMGISPAKLNVEEGGRHLSPEEFHDEIDSICKKSQQDTILLDCRNFYESKIGYFEHAIRPDLRKFSYFPDYVDKNTEIFNNKKVLMYCTGGIRCERASAYMIKEGNCKEVLQLKGGIHKYLEKYPNGHYKGKLFVFDERYSIGGRSQNPVSKCKYCGKPHDQYKLCTTSLCRQLVLSCNDCREKGNTACCEDCQQTACDHDRKQECECTKTREQAPIEKYSF